MYQFRYSQRQNRPKEGRKMSPEESYQWELRAFDAFSKEAIKKKDPNYIERCLKFKEEIDGLYTSNRIATNNTPEDSPMEVLKKIIAYEGEAKSFRDSLPIIGDTSRQAPSRPIRRELGRHELLRTGLSPAPL